MPPSLAGFNPLADLVHTSPPVYDTNRMIYDTNRMKTRSRLWWVSLLGILAGCGGGATLVQDTDRGGIVAYSFSPQRGAMMSSSRREALQLIEQRCRGRYQIVREGEAKGRDRVSSVVAGAEEVVHDHRWGIQFECR